ncbi:MAG: hypothetical protein CMD26_05525 [Flavobacteriales bacterium]|nr:hypothetical protein [Flavobacteriales bacterium]|tara:strand:+ start:4855 stop:7668 length:2814 start_codon:yes stop_codon:yes gene_type:complete
MENSFLFKISKQLLRDYVISDLVIILPSRRSSVFLKKEIAKSIDKPTWLPRIYSIDDFIFEVNNFNSASSLELFFSFYDVYESIVQKPHSIERCYKWASGLLEDFNEIDKAYTCPKEIFSYLSDVKRIESWYLDIASNEEEINEYLDFFNNLKHIYDKLQLSLKSNNIAYSGLAQRLLVDNINQIPMWLKDNKKEKIIFIGLDALTNCQEKIIDSLLSKKICDIFWDADEYFIKNHIQESGKFLRRYIQKWPQCEFPQTNDFLNFPKSIDIIGTTKNVNQAKLLSQLLLNKNYSSIDESKRIAIVLPNEDLLLPVLESIPSYISDINVTMGYKLLHHPIASLVEEIISLIINSRDYDTKQKSNSFLKKDIIQLIQTPYFNLFLNSRGDSLDKNLLQEISKINLNYIGYCDLNSISNLDKIPFLKNIFLTNFRSSLDLVSFLQETISVLLESLNSSEENTDLEQECLFEIQEQLLSFARFLENSRHIISPELLTKLFSKTLKSIRLNFSGEPLIGIQIMGILESRAIDFDEVFILSANESELPPDSGKNSFIPFDVKLKFGIRTHLDMDAIYANYFFNLIKRPKKVSIIYNQDLLSSSSGEKSRFINQLLYEIKTLPGSNIRINNYTASDVFQLELENNNRLFKLKDAYVISKLVKICNKGISPSTINLYNYCKKQFYYEKILDVSSIDNLENDIDKATMGTIVHWVLQKIYEPYLGMILDNSIMGKIICSVPETLENAIKKHGVKNISKGKNFLTIEAIKRIIKNFVKSEASNVKKGDKIKVLSLEREIIAPYKKIKISNFNLVVDISLKGYIDRIDIYNDVYRIIDYKTGLVQDVDLRTSDIAEIIEKPKILQLLIYAWLFKRNNQDHNLSMQAGIINLRAKNFDFQKCVINKIHEIDNSILQSLENTLDDFFLELFDHNQDFDHKNIDDQCRFCD